MFSVQKDDFQPLNDFEYIYYWTDPDIFPEKVLEHIHVLRPIKAKELEMYLMKDCQTLSLSLFQEIPTNPENTTPFIAIERLLVDNNSIKEVRSWLSSQEIPLEMIFYLSWNSTTAIALTWDIFYQYWDAFCLIGLDDICICSLNEMWRILYYHEGIFLIGKKKQK